MASRDPRGLTISRTAAVQQSYAQKNPQKFRGYGPHCWGVSASDGPGPATKAIENADRDFWMYKARGVPEGPDDGTLAPGAVAASLPFVPNLVADGDESRRQICLQDP
jgi:hypothetical protein